MRELEDYTSDELYDFLDRLAERRKTAGRGRSPEAYQARHYCDVMRPKVKAELKRRKLKMTRPDDTRCYGSGGCKWQKAGGAAK